MAKINQKRKLAIITRAYEISSMSKISHPLIKKYADKCNADFIIIDKRKINIGPFHNEIFQSYDLLSRYERILCIDSDVIISPKTPNIFNIVPEDKIGVVLEDVGFRKYSRHNDIQNVQKKFGDVGWKSGYINTGFIVYSRQHKDLFKINQKYFWNDLGYDDIQIGYMIHKLNFEICQLSYKFNHMSIFSEFGHNWLKSYVIHYAGTGFYRRMSRDNQMLRDLELIDQAYPLLILVNILPRARLLAIFIYGYITYFKNTFFKSMKEAFK
jgi:lipopolysaccharide biosynthesis glycosyltransferase